MAGKHVQTGGKQCRNLNTTRGAIGTQIQSFRPMNLLEVFQGTSNAEPRTELACRTISGHQSSNCAVRGQKVWFLCHALLRTNTLNPWRRIISRSVFPLFLKKSADTTDHPPSSPSDLSQSISGVPCGNLSRSAMTCVNDLASNWLELNSFRPFAHTGGKL